MASLLEEKLREASCIGDIDGVLALLSQNLDINSKNPINGWTALHWACKRNNSEIVRILLNHGADRTIENNKGETAGNVASTSTILGLLGETNSVPTSPDELGLRFTPNYLKNTPLNGQVEIGRLRPKHADLASMPTTTLPSSLNNDLADELVLKVKLHGSSDPDFIEIEIAKWKLTYNNLLKICCEELEVVESQVERIRKLPNTRLRKDNDVKRLKDYQAIEIVLKSSLNNEKSSNCYQSISTCKNQTILY